MAWEGDVSVGLALYSEVVMKKLGFRPQPMNKSFRGSRGNVALSSKTRELLKKEVSLSIGYDLIPEFCIETGIPSLDVISAKAKNERFGIPCGSVIGVVGEPSQGKTTLCLNIIAEAQRESPHHPVMVPFFIETEGNLSKEYMEDNDVDTSQIMIPPEDNYPETLEEAYDLIRETLRALSKVPKEERDPLFIVLDSMSAMPTNEERDSKKFGESGSRAAHARINSAAMRTLTPLLTKTNSILVVVAQERSDLGWGKSPGAKTWLGARPVKFHSSLVYEISRTGWLKKSGKFAPIGMTCKILIIKSKVGIPFQSANPVILDFELGGFDGELSLHEALVDSGLMNKKGNTYTLHRPLKSGKTLSYISAKGIKKLAPKEKRFLTELLFKHAAKSRAPKKKVLNP